MIKDQEDTLDRLRKLFWSFEDLRHYIDAATHITASILRIDEAKSASQDKLCKDMEKMKLANEHTCKTLDCISADVRNLKEDTHNPKALHRMEEGLTRIERLIAVGQYRVSGSVIPLYKTDFY